MDSQSFKKRYGPWAVVTGASDGIGRAFAEQLAKSGLNVVLVARRGDVLQHLARELTGQHGIATMVVAVDLATKVGRLALENETSHLDIGLYVASAGFGTTGSILESDLNVEHEMLEVNCFALLSGCVTFGRRLRNRGGGALVLMSSLVAWQGTPKSAHYAATKAYVQSLAESLHIELRPFNIDVIASAPGPVHSGFAARADMIMTAAVAPATVAAATLRALGSRATVVPGALSKILTWSLLPLPRSLRARVMGHVMTGMTKHQQVIGPDLP